MAYSPVANSNPASPLLLQLNAIAATGAYDDYQVRFDRTFEPITEVTIDDQNKILLLHGRSKSKET